MGHQQAAEDRLAGGDIDEDPAVRPSSTPARRGSLTPRPVTYGPVVADREPVEVAAVFVGEVGDKRRPPAWDEAIIGAQGAQAGEAGINDAQLVPLGPPPSPMVGGGGAEGAVQAISWLRMSPVTDEVRGREQASYLSAGSSFWAMSGALRKIQT